MTAEASRTLDLPPFVRRTLGLRSRRRIPYDTAVRIRWGDSARLLTHPDDVRHVLVDNAENYSKTRQLTGPQGRQRAGAGLLTASGAEHRRQRGLLQPLFHRRVIEGFTATMVARIERAMRNWRDGTELDIAREMAELTLSVMLDSLFGIDRQDDDGALAGAIDARRRHTDYVYHSRMPFRTVLPTRIVRDYRSAIALIDDRIAREIRLRHDGHRSGEDLLSMLTGVKYADGSSMSDRQIRDEVLTLTSAGYETLGEALAWTWYLLARHPEVETRLFAEVERTLDGRAPTATEIAELEFTTSVLRESMRLYPPTWIYERVAHRADRLPSGAGLNAGTAVYLCQYVMHRHPEYFPDPERFDPERFLPPSQRPFRFAYFPFGDGAHTCIGEHFAMLQGACALAMLARRFRFSLVPGRTVVPRAGVTLSPKHGIHVRAQER